MKKLPKLKKPNKLSQFRYQVCGYNRDLLDAKMYTKCFFNFDFDDRDDIAESGFKLSHTNQNIILRLLPKFRHGNSSKIVGRGCDIANLLSYGYWTVDDITVASKIRKQKGKIKKSIGRRTAERWLHTRKPDKYHRKKPHFPHVIKLYNIDDDCYFHYRIHKHGYTCNKNNLFGELRPKTVVDSNTFTHFEWLIHSQYIKEIKSTYRDKTHLQLVYQLINEKRKEYKERLKQEILVKFATKYGSTDVFKQLYRANLYYANRIARVEEICHEQNDFPVVSKLWLTFDAKYYFNYLIKHQYHNSWEKWHIALRYTVTNPLLYGYLNTKLSYKYREENYKYVYHSDKYHLMTKEKWAVLRFITPYHKSISKYRIWDGR